MKRLVLKYLLFLLLLVTGVSVLWTAGAFVWSRGILTAYMTPLAQPGLAPLGVQLNGNPNRQSIRTFLAKTYRQSDIVMSAVIDMDGTVIARGMQKRESVIWPLYLRFPVMTGATQTAWLKLWPAPESLYRELIAGANRYVIVLWAFTWWLCIMLPAILYFWRHLFGPLQRLRQFVRRIEHDEYVPLDFGSRHPEWNEIAEQLNHLNDKISDTNATLQMLFSVSQTLTSHLDINETFGTVIELIQKKFGGLPCGIILPSEDGFLKVRIQHGLSPEFARLVHLKPGEGVTGQCYASCQPAIINDVSTMEPSVFLTQMQLEGMFSFAHIPLMSDNRCCGLLSVGNAEKGYFTEDRINTLTSIAKYLSIALANIQLYERIHELNRRLETEVTSTTRELIQTNSRLIHKVREMKALSDIAAFAAAKVNLDEILEMIVEKIKELLTAQAAGFFLAAPDKGEVVPQAPFFGVRDRDFADMRFKDTEIEPIRAVIAEGKNFIFNAPHEAAAAVPLLSNILPVHSLVLVPLRSGKKNVGVLGVANKFGAAFDQDDVRILELIGDRISGIIENVRLYQELEKRLRDLTVLQDISSAISSEPVWDKTLAKVISATTTAFGADLCALLFVDEKNNELVTQPGAHFTGGDEAVLLRIPVTDTNSLSAQVFRSGEPFLSPDASIDPRIKSQTARLWDVRSIILVPLKAENRVIGVLRIGKHQANCYTNDDLRLAALIAHQAAIIIENAHLYRSLHETKNELEQLNQIKNEFISMVSHELRTPLTAVKGFVKVVLTGEAGPVNAQQEKFLQIADQSIDRLTVLISDLLDISRIESGQLRLNMEPQDAREVIGLVIENIIPAVKGKNLNIGSDLPEHMPPVLADRERLIQVFDNLIHNAIKFTPEGGRITVAASNKGDFINFSVTDTGIGIAPDDHERIFEKFYQVESGTTRSTSGTGLGLAIVKSIVEMHGGQVWVESEQGNGATFQFLLPRAKTEIRDFRRDQDQDEPLASPPPAVTKKTRSTPPDVLH